MTKTNIINTKFGRIQGYVDNGLDIFKGIPYAAPPINELRFKPPQESPSWNKVLKATEFGPYAPQGFTLLEDLFGKCEYQNENNCLTLNIWRPKTEVEKLPVMVYIHGGSFIFGGSADIWYGVNGFELSRNGKVITITFNYRLGAFGFLYLPEETVNIGIQDQIAALIWIKENIQAFGGDPENITLFGESAGGLSVIILSSIPRANGLFQRAIAQSAPIIDIKPTIRSTKELMKELKIEVGDINALRKLSTEKIISAQNKIIEKWTNQETNEIMDFRPSIDGNIIPYHPIESFKKGLAKDIDLLIGTNRDETKLWTAPYSMMQNLEREDLYNLIQMRINKYGNGNLSKDPNFCYELVEIYENCLKITPNIRPIDVYDAIDTDFTFRIPAIRIAEAQSKYNKNVFNYIFTWHSPALEGRYGSCHILEIPFVFGTIGKTGVEWFFGEGVEANQLSDKLLISWSLFARNGDPNHKNIPKWPSYDMKKRSTMNIGRKFEIINDIYAERRKAWSKISFF